jgi:tetratricopeptide (TPR) repeat protein
VGGPGSIGPFPYTLDLMVCHTWQIHDEIERLLHRLRDMPPVFASHPAMRPAQLPHPVTFSDFELETLIELLTSCVRPQTWDQVGGSGSIMPDFPRGALIISQTQDIHKELRHVLTQLRRSRYGQVRPDRPWEAGAGPGRPMIDPWGLGAATDGLQPSKLPEPKPAELAALHWRRMPERGRWVWRRVTPEGDAVETITLIQDGRRLEVVLPECSVRIEGEHVAVAWPELGLVELGPWAEAIRHVLDARLPWLPHRTNENLARWYQVAPAPAKHDGVEAPPVRLIPPGYDANSGTYLLLEPSEAEHLPARVASFLEVEQTGLLRWAAGDPGGPAIVWEGASGQLLARWELVEHTAEPAPLPPPAEPRDGFVQLDRRGAEQGDDRLLAEALAALEKRGWPEAAGKLAELSRRNPGHPLLAILRAWCHDQAPNLEPADERLADLQAAVAAGHPVVSRWLAEGHLAWLKPEHRYRILSESPKEPQTWGDVHALVKLAMQTRRHEEALSLLDRAIKADVSGHDRSARFDQQRLRVELLLKLDWFLEAEAAASLWAERDDAAPGEIAVLAETLLAADRRQVAADLLAQAAGRDPAPEERARLLRRLADLCEGLPRWERLIEAAELLPDDSPLRRRWIDTLLGELDGPIHARVPAQLAEKSRDDTLRTRLRIIHAGLLVDLRAAGDVFWELAEEGNLPAERMPWAMSLWNRAKHPERTIALCEQELRRGRRFDRDLLPVLCEAYLAAGRPVDARRAETDL